MIATSYQLELNQNNFDLKGNIALAKKEIHYLPFVDLPNCSDGGAVTTSCVGGDVDGSANTSFNNDRSTSSGSTK